MGSFGPLEIFLVFLVILLVFGAKRIPEIARGLGKGISEFKRATQDMASEFDVDEPSSPRLDQQRRQPTGTTPRTSSAQQPAPSQDEPSNPEGEDQKSSEPQQS